MVTKDATITIPPKSAHAVKLHKGERLRIIDVEGGQVADLVAFATDDLDESFSQGFTRMNNEKASVGVGDALYSNKNRVLMRVSADSVQVHDLLFPPCNRFLYEEIYGVPGKSGCRENLARALEGYGVPESRITDPFNVFMHTRIDPATQKMQILPPTSGPGDFLEVAAEQDLILAISSCAADVTDCNGGHCTSIQVQVGV
ncbi:DUF1989 domain-containing protein [Janibacter limosus]|uniref:DUF1989 domain-containing protein n=1 Tax=Janibacter limosus TaxID=53458 RepID=UPI00082E671B|nr:urea carboxylase-associated family protein [Janibacter limosus]